MFAHRLRRKANTNPTLGEGILITQFSASNDEKYLLFFQNSAKMINLIILVDFFLKPSKRWHANVVYLSAIWELVPWIRCKLLVKQDLAILL